MFENPPSMHADLDEAWRRIESMLDDVAQWARNADSLAEFYEVLLQRMVTELEVAGGAVWSLDSHQRLLRIDMVGSPAIDALTQRADHLEKIQETFRRRTDQPDAEPAYPATTATQSQISSEGLVSCLASVIVDSEVVGVLELVLADDTTVSSRENAQHVMAALTDVAVDFHRTQQLRDLRQQVAAWKSAQEFSDCVHRRLGLDETCYAIANEGRRFVGADRVSVLVMQRGSLRVRAISGVDSIDRRSPEVIAMRRLARAIARFGEPLWTQDVIERPPQIQQLINEFHDASGARGLAIIPIKADSPTGKSQLLGVLVVEHFKCDAFEAAEKERLGISCRQAKTALANALEMNGLPLLWLSRSMRSLGWLFGFQSLTMFALVLIGALLLLSVGVAALCLVPMDFTITARGHLQPVERRDIFAPADGVVQETRVQHGDEVALGAVLVRLRNTELDYEARRLVGDLATTQAKLRAVQAARLTAGGDRLRTDQVNADVERYKTILEGMQQQHEIIKRQLQDLNVRSPLSGQVMSWEAGKTLASRPVRQGQRLMTIANVKGSWHLEVDVSDEDIGHVLNARNMSDSGRLPVTFILLTDPAISYRGEVAQVALGTVVTGKREPAVRVTVDLDSNTLSLVRPGAGVVARIHCGRRSIGYVWFRSAYEKLRMQFMF
jgi:multidrug efflux pump subunit AcrA (membrane-fusion protein)